MRSRMKCGAGTRRACFFIVIEVPHHESQHLPEPTEEELEVMIVEQMQCLPSWWKKDLKRMNQWEQTDAD